MALVFNYKESITYMTDMVTHSTGAKRTDCADNFRYDLISPIGLKRLAETCKEGADKYGDFNWEKGFPVCDLLNHAIAHIYAYLAGDRSEDHLGHAAWNLFASMHSEEKWPELNKGKLRCANGEPPFKFEEDEQELRVAHPHTDPDEFEWNQEDPDFEVVPWPEIGPVFYFKELEEDEAEDIE